MSETPEINPLYTDMLQTQSTDYDGKKRKRIRIDVADMQIALERFKKNVLRKNFSTPVLGLIAAWLPFASSEFRPMFGYEAQTVGGVYFGIVLCITVGIVKAWIWPINWSLLWSVRRGRKTARKENGDTSDPEKLANILYERGEEGH